MRVQATRWGQQTGMLLPQEVTDELRIVPGSELDLTVQAGELRIRPVRRKSSRQLLEAMVAEAKRLGPEHESETVDWGPDPESERIEDGYSRGEITLEDILNGSARGR
jgi:antitoxin MazE